MMKNIIKLIVVIVILFAHSCKKLDRFPLDGPSTETFYANKVEFDLAINGLYLPDVYPFFSEMWTDNVWQRTQVGNPITNGTTTIQSTEFSAGWTTAYKGIARANILLANLGKPVDVTEAYRNSAAAQARLVRAYCYSFLVALYGDVPLVQKPITLQESRQLVRTPKAEVIKAMYDDFDFAALVLPLTNTGPLQYHTKGVAMAMKARAAISINDWTTAAAAAKALMDLNNYSLYPSYRDLFLKVGQNSKEVIWSIPRSATFNRVVDLRYEMSRLTGGFASNVPTLDLIDSYECTDGKPIDVSPLYSPKTPFVNRDPRLKATIVTPGDRWLGYDYQNHPDATMVLNYTTGKMVPNSDAKNASNAFASFTGYLFKKGIDESILLNTARTDFDLILIRYAEILLTYAEAKIELNQIDASVLAAINSVRARAYGVAPTATTAYPAVTTTNQIELRRILRRERKVEMAFDGGGGLNAISNTFAPSMRYMDLLRWKLAEKVFSKPVYGVPLNKLDYPFVDKPIVDADDVASYEAFKTKILLCDTRRFDKTRHYVWPIPLNEILQNPALQQNPEWK